MKRRKLISILEKNGCHLERHGGNHDVYTNPANNKRAPVPRHSEIAETLCKIILKQLGLKK